MHWQDLSMDSPEFNLAFMVEELTYNWNDKYRTSTFTAEDLFKMHNNPGGRDVWIPFFRQYGFNFDLPTIRKGLEILRKSGDLVKEGNIYTSHETGFWGHLGEQPLGSISIDASEIDESDPNLIKLLSALSKADPSIIEQAREQDIDIPPYITTERRGFVRDLENTKEHKPGISMDN